MKVIVTGSAGFIGSTLIIQLLAKGHNVIGIDCINDYYDPDLKISRLERFIDNPKYIDIREDISDSKKILEIFDVYKPDAVINLAAQAGVRYSIENPKAYVDTNLVGFANILEGCRHSNTKHLIYASSSSVYGSNTSMPFSIHENVDHPLSLYAATKKSNELMAHTYSHLFNLPTTGLRFFTVYGPWGRPDMALFKFTKNILSGEPIDVFNYGNHMRDFTYIDDIVTGIMKVIQKPAKINESWDSENPDPGTSNCPWRVYNIGNNNPVKLMDYIEALEESIGLKAIKNLLPLQPGDVESTYADVSDLINDFDYKPAMPVKDGVAKFVDWYKDYYKA